MIKGSKPFLIISFAIAFGIAFFFAHKMYPIFSSEEDYVTKFAAINNKKLPNTDESGNTLDQIIALEPNTLQLVYTTANIELYKVNQDSLIISLQNNYKKPSNFLKDILKDNKQDITIEYLFKDKNQTKITSFKKQFVTLTK